MSENDKAQMTINLYEELRNMKQEDRDEWRRESLKRCPDSADYIETVYKCACN